MSIDIKIGTKTDAAKIYLIEFQNRTIIDKKFDKLHRQNKMQWTKKFTKYGYPVIFNMADGSFPRQTIRTKKENRCRYPWFE